MRADRGTPVPDHAQGAAVMDSADVPCLCPLGILLLCRRTGSKGPHAAQRTAEPVPAGHLAHNPVKAIFGAASNLRSAMLHRGTQILQARCVCMSLDILAAGWIAYLSSFCSQACSFRCQGRLLLLQGAYLLHLLCLKRCLLSGPLVSRCSSLH